MRALPDQVEVVLDSVSLVDSCHPPFWEWWRSDGSHNFHWILLIVNKETAVPADAAREHGNLCVVSTQDVDRCDSPALREMVLRNPSHGAKIWEKLKCCPQLQPGDAVFYREDVAHRTQDQVIDRTSMVIRIESDRPRRPTHEDVRCAGWAADGACSTHQKLMGCVCSTACRSHDEL